MIWFLFFLDSPVGMTWGLTEQRWTPTDLWDARSAFHLCNTKGLIRRGNLTGQGKCHQYIVRPILLGFYI